MKIGIGIIGCGSITVRRHAPEYAANPNCEIKGFFDMVPERAKTLSGQYGGRTYEDYHELLSDPDIEAVSVCTPNCLHAPVTIEALRAGKHVLCEKPMAVSVGEADSMVAAADRAGRQLMIGHHQRFMGAHRKAKELLSSGAMGRVLSFKTFLTHAGPEGWSVYKSPGTWFFDKNQAVFGALGDLGVHKCDLIQWLLGDRIADVVGYAATNAKRDENGQPAGVDDLALAILKTAGGVAGIMEVCWYNTGRIDNGTTLFCENGVLKMFVHPDYDLVVEMKNGDRAFHKLGGFSVGDNQVRSGVIDAFVDALVSGSPVPVPGTEGRRALAAVAACLESSRTGSWVHVG